MPRIPFESDAIPLPKVSHADEGGAAEGYRTLTLRTERGPVETRLYEAAGARSAALFVGGVGGGFDTPALGLYPRLGGELMREGISALRVRFRRSTELTEATHDVLAGLLLLGERGVTRVGLVGHSFGGAVVVAAAVASPLVMTVVTLATQSYGTEGAAKLSPRSLLLLHGTDDEILPPTSSWTTFRMARQPKELKLLEGARHCLDEMAEEVHGMVHDWLVQHLRPPEPEGTL